MADALIQGLQLDRQTCTRLYDKIGRRVLYHQSRNAHARACHTRATIRKLHSIGIKLTTLRRCEENTS